MPWGSQHESCLRNAGAPLGAILNFLLQLGFREVGSAFRVGALSSVERTIAADVAQLGLLVPFMYAPLISWHTKPAGLGVVKPMLSWASSCPSCVLRQPPCVVLALPLPLLAYKTCRTGSCECYALLGPSCPL